jgi:tagatose 6-phosphate kinase
MIITVTLNASVDKLFLVEQFLPNTVMRVKACYNSAGGKGLNMSRVAALAGEKVLATGFVGGYAGEYIRSMLERDGINSEFITIQGETRSCINVRDLSTGKHSEFLEPGAQVGESDLEKFLSLYQQVIKESQVVAISGSMPKGVPVNFYGKLVSMAKIQGKTVILDTSGEALKENLASKPTMIKPNADEIRQLFHSEVYSLNDLVHAAQKLHQDGIAIVVISMGKEGSLVACRDGIFHSNAPDVEVINTVGCGDSMVAGFAVGLSRNYSLLECFRYAVAVSAANAMTMETGSICTADLQRLLPLVKIERIESV